MCRDVTVITVIRVIITMVYVCCSYVIKSVSMLGCSKLKTFASHLFREARFLYLDIVIIIIMLIMFEVLVSLFL